MDAAFGVLSCGVWQLINRQPVNVAAAAALAHHSPFLLFPFAYLFHVVILSTLLTWELSRGEGDAVFAVCSAPRHAHSHTHTRTHTGHGWARAVSRWQMPSFPSRCWGGGRLGRHL